MLLSEDRIRIHLFHESAAKSFTDRAMEVSIYLGLLSKDIPVFYTLSDQTRQRENKKMKTVEAIRIRIKELMKEKGMSEYRLISRTGMPPSTVKSVLKGKSENPRVCTITGLCKGLGITVKEFYDSELFDDWCMVEADEEGKEEFY